MGYSAVNKLLFIHKNKTKTKVALYQLSVKIKTQICCVVFKNGFYCPQVVQTRRGLLIVWGHTQWLPMIGLQPGSGGGRLVERRKHESSPKVVSVACNWNRLLELTRYLKRIYTCVRNKC